MNELIQDFYVQHWLRKFINTLPYNERQQLKNLRLCNSKIVQPGHPVFLLSNGEQSKFHGQATCKNTFACPCCSARIANKHAKKIADCLDMFKKDYYAVMATFTIPHLKWMSCKEITDILYDTWILCFKNKTSKRERKVNVFREWWQSTEIKYFIRAMEYTWGKNGWHPHFHCIFFFPRDKVETFYSFEQQINDKWWRTAKLKTRQYWEKYNLHSKYNYSDLEDLLFITKKFSVKFSTYECTSSNYITGWTSDKEMTGNVHKSASWEGHYTPYQILTKAVAGDTEMAQLYREFMLNVTRKPVHHRFEYSQGLNKLIQQYQQTKKLKEVITKKNTSAKWEVLWWFEKQEWNYLNDLNREFPILSNILWIATHSKNLLKNFLAFYGISAPKIRHIWVDSVEKAFNSAA